MKTMKRGCAIFFSLAIILCLVGCKSATQSTMASKGVRKLGGNGVITHKVIDIADYTNIKHTNTGYLIYEQSNAAPFLRIEIDENLMQYVACEVKDGVLDIRYTTHEILQPTSCRIYTNSRTLGSINLAGVAQMQLSNTTTSNNLNINLSGAGRLETNNVSCRELVMHLDDASKVAVKGRISGDIFNINLHGASKIEAKEIDYTNLTVDGLGTSEALFRGKVTAAKYNLGGSTNIDARYLTSRTSSCVLQGVSLMTVHATELLDITTSGVAKVGYRKSSVLGNISSSEVSNVYPID